MHRLILRRPCKGIFQPNLRQTYRKNSNGLPPNSREAGFGKIALFLSPVLIVGGTVTYAKNDKEFRQTLEKNIPGAEWFIKIALQEEKPFKNVTKQLDSISESIDKATSSITSLFGGSSSESATKPPTGRQSLKEIGTEGPTTKSVGKPSQESAAKPSSSKQPVENERKHEDKAKFQPETKKKTAESLPNNILEIEKSIEVAASLAVKEYNKAIEILKRFNEDVRHVVEHAVENVDTAIWTTLKNKTNARDTSVETAESLAREATTKMEQFEIALSKAATADNHKQVMALRDKIKSLADHINKVKDELYKNKDLATVSEKYWRSVEKARNYFIEEIESIFPGIDLAEKKLQLSEDDLNLFITHAYSHVLAYQKELERLQTDGELKLKRAIEAVRGDDNIDAVKSQVEYMVEAERRKIAIENQKKIFKIRAEYERQLRDQLKKQAEAHVDHIVETVAIKEAEIKRNLSRELEVTLAKEKANYKLQLAAMVGKMRGMDAALQARSESERCAHQAQALWAASQALWATVRTGEAGVHWKGKLRPLKSEIATILKAAEDDELVAVVLENLPREAEERGVYPEDALRERFMNVERVAKKLALVPEDGASLIVHFLSYLQSLLIIKPSQVISQDELENKKFDYSKLDTYDILNRARYFVDRGDLMNALKYMNLLQGAPRKVAMEWLKETRLLLETQQAANTLMAHASASGLLYL